MKPFSQVKRKNQSVTTATVAARSRCRPNDINYYGPVLRVGNNEGEQYPKLCSVSYRPPMDAFIRRQTPVYIPMLPERKVEPFVPIPAGLVIKSRTKPSTSTSQIVPTPHNVAEQRSIPYAGLVVSSYRPLNMF